MPVLIKFGALDERFSLWSAKPAKAVRLRHAPHKNSVESLDSTLIFYLCFFGGVCNVILTLNQNSYNICILLTSYHLDRSEYPFHV